ncbi:hypothetical protein E3A20_21800 [Planctomyces bekefii]|uniref:Nucleotidyltransferase n=1 Tax=Planctomyces bekefii TaxID=1653850 RepID=A0A5C6M6N0_9PLAN|nr:hypothetical protein E3A20_21800 [Planctomyces bekefii]
MEFHPIEVLRRFDELLQSKGLEFKDGVVIGGTAISLLYRHERFTQDVDLLTPIPPLVKAASREFAAKEGLAEDWLNNRVVNLDNCKPMGWGKDLVPLFEGVSLSLYSVSRINLLRIKLFAACDRAEGMAIDLPDVKSMNPTRVEVGDATQWVRGELSRQRRSMRENQQFLQILDAIEKLLG